VPWAIRNRDDAPGNAGIVGKAAFYKGFKGPGTGLINRKTRSAVAANGNAGSTLKQLFGFPGIFAKLLALHIVDAKMMKAVAGDPRVREPQSSSLCGDAAVPPNLR